MAGAAGAGAAAFGRLLGVAQIVDGFERLIGAHVVDDVVFFRRTDPIEFRPIEFHFGTAHQLVEIQRRIDRAERQAVGFGDAIDIVGADDVAGAGHVLHHDRRIAGDILADVTRRQPRPKIVAAGGGGRDHHGNRFALIKIRLRECPFKVQGVQQFNKG